VSAAPGPFSPDEEPPGHLFLLLDPEAGAERRRETWRRLAYTLPRLSWRSHLYLIGEAPGRDLEAAREAARLAGAFLEEHAFALLHLHPGLHLGARGGEARESWSRLCDLVLPFQERAYEEQSESVLFLSPLLLPGPEASASDLDAAMALFSSRLATPSVFLPPGWTPPASAGQGVRLYGGSERSDLAHLGERLRAHHLFESLLTRLDARGAELLAPCARHLVFDERSELPFSCLRLHESGETGSPVRPGDCPGCLGASLPGMEKDLALNRRLGEGYRVLLELATSMGARGEHRPAAELSASAARLAGGPEERAGALLRQGLALLDLGELAEAEETLRRAQPLTADPAFVAYQRGRVQFAWRDYIEALERYEEALETGSPRLRAEDIHLDMATCHINLEEYPEARSHLEASLPPGERAATVSFYRGVCELGEGRVEPALALFREALGIGPADEDRGRVLFYVGTCLKERERFEEAVTVLREAVEADPEDIANHNLLGFCYYKLKRHEEAVRCFRRAVEIDPRSAMDWANLGSNLRDLGRREEAIAMYEKALALDPFIGFARAGLARLRRSSGDPEAGS
jgi:tetratricopeptide (TPR) repeat protein